MTKRMVNLNEDVKDMFDGIPLFQIADNIEKLIGLYGEDAYLDIDVSWEYPTVNLRYAREETDVEYAWRIQREAEQYAVRLNNEYQQYLQLKNKFGGD